MWPPVPSMSRDPSQTPNVPQSLTPTRPLGFHMRIYNNNNYNNNIIIIIIIMTITRGSRHPCPQCTKTAPAATLGDTGGQGDTGRDHARGVPAAAPAPSPALIVAAWPRAGPVSPSHKGHHHPGGFRGWRPRAASPRRPSVSRPRDVSLGRGPVASLRATSVPCPRGMSPQRPSAPRPRAICATAPCHPSCHVPRPPLHVILQRRVPVSHPCAISVLRPRVTSRCHLCAIPPCHLSAVSPRCPSVSRPHAGSPCCPLSYVSAPCPCATFPCHVTVPSPVPHAHVTSLHRATSMPRANITPPCHIPVPSCRPSVPSLRVTSPQCPHVIVLHPVTSVCHIPVPSPCPHPHVTSPSRAPVSRPCAASVYHVPVPHLQATSRCAVSRVASQRAASPCRIPVCRVPALCPRVTSQRVTSSCHILVPRPGDVPCQCPTARSCPHPCPYSGTSHRGWGRGQWQPSSEAKELLAPGKTEARATGRGDMEGTRAPPCPSIVRGMGTSAGGTTHGDTPGCASRHWDTLGHVGTHWDP